MRSLFGLVFLLFLAGCAKSPPAQTCCVFPKTSVSLFLGASSGDLITISQVGDSVHVARNSQSREVPLDSSFHRFLEPIVQSERWQQQATSDLYQGPWSGSPRTILSLEHDFKSLSFQGKEAPAAWVKSIEGYLDAKLK